MNNIFRCEICWFDAKTYQTFKKHLDKNSCGKHNRRKIINGKKYRICEANTCKEVASYSRDRVPLRCKNHKLKTDFLSKAQRCIVDDCMRQPFYGCGDRRKRERCCIHKLDSDTNLNNK